MQNTFSNRFPSQVHAGISAAGDAHPAAQGIPDHPFFKRQLSGPERMTAYMLGAGLILIAVAVSPFVNIKLIPLPGFLLIYSTALFVLDMLVAVLLLSKARIESNHSYILLAIAYLYAGFIIIPHLTAFPNVLVPGIIAGVPGSAIWIWVFWHGGFAALIIGYALLAKRSSHGPLGFVAPLCAALLLVAAVAYVGIFCVPDLPVMLQGTRYFPGLAGHVVGAVVLILNVGAFALVITTFRLRNAEDLWLAVGMIGACVDVSLTLAAGQRFSLGWYCGRVCGISTVFVLLISLLNDVLMTYSSFATANDLLDKLTLTDPLTSLGNRRLFDAVLDKEWRRCRRENTPLTVVMLDVDDFKSYNDTYGHQAGDSCLQKIAVSLQASAARPGDLALRYGGEEFALILPATDSAGGEHLARLMRLRVRDLAIPHAGSERAVITVSAGIATLIPSESFEMTELVRLADIALYRAKAAGRDAVMVAG